MFQGTLLRNSSGNHSPYPHSPYGTLGGSHSPSSPYQFNANGLVSPASMNSLAFDGATDLLLANSPQPAPETVRLLYRPRSYAEKARINAGYVPAAARGVGHRAGTWPPITLKSSQISEMFIRYVSGSVMYCVLVDSVILPPPAGLRVVFVCVNPSRLEATLC